ncbi:MAG: hypothetical protein J0H17_09690 [Rhizobiales bacterium]|nr:hypothetical protein [Hyphomicrobiales bacterium]
MTDPMQGLEQAAARPDTDWTWWLIAYVRTLAVVSMIKGLFHWAVICGLMDGAESTFDMAPVAWKSATIFFAVIDLVAAVGLWLAAAWGGVVWLTAAISMAAVEIFFPQVFGGNLAVVVLEMAAVGVYLWLALMAGGDRPE